MKAPSKSVEPIQSAGGIVVREGPEPRIAIVRLRKDKAWVLPKGKLKPGEAALAAAEREVEEETGHYVFVHEFLGAMSYTVGRGPKVTQFWRMRAVGEQARKLTRDVRAVKWLPLDEAIETLTHAHERTFLAEVGPIALEKASRNSAAAEKRSSLVERIRAWWRRLIS
jgi:8-oxo-dGTP diphosphatase